MIFEIFEVNAVVVKILLSQFRQTGSILEHIDKNCVISGGSYSPSPTVIVFGQKDVGCDPCLPSVNNSDP